MPTYPIQVFLADTVREGCLEGYCAELSTKTADIQLKARCCPCSCLRRGDHHAAPAAGVSSSRGGCPDRRSADTAGCRPAPAAGRRQLAVDGLPRAVRARDASADAARRPFSCRIAVGALRAESQMSRKEAEALFRPCIPYPAPVVGPVAVMQSSVHRQPARTSEAQSETLSFTLPSP